MSQVNDLIDVCHRVYKKQFVSAYDGNLSVKISENSFLITRSGVCKGDVTEKDILEIDSSGNILNGSGKVSTEVKIHLFAYKHRKDVSAVVHCHPIYSTAFAAFGEGFRKNIFPEVVLTLGEVPLCEYGTPSTDELPESMLPFIKSSSALLLQNHGAVTFGKNILDAYFKMEKLEHQANIIFLARLLGGEKEIPDNKVEQLLRISKSVYGIEK